MTTPDRQTGSLPKEPKVFATLRKLPGPTGLIFPDAYNVSWEAKILHKASPAARDIFDRAKVVGFPGSALLEGSKEGESLVGRVSYYTYQAIIFELFSRGQETQKVNFLAGLGAGFLVALFASRAISFETGLGLVYETSFDNQRPFSERLRHAYSIGLHGEPRNSGDGISDPEIPIISGRNGQIISTANQIRDELAALTKEQAEIDTIREAMKREGINSPLEMSSRGFLTKLRENRKFAALGAAGLVAGGVVLAVAYRRARRPKS